MEAVDPLMSPSNEGHIVEQSASTVLPSKRGFRYTANTVDVALDCIGVFLW